MSNRARRTLIASVALVAFGLGAPACSSTGEPTTTPGSTTATVPPATPPGTTTGTGAPSIRDADLTGMPVPAAWCDGLEGVVDGTVTLVDGKAGASDPGPGKTATGPAFELDADPTLYGDINGDGVEDAVVRLSCFHWASDDAQTHVAVFSIRDGRPTVTTAIDAAGVDHKTKDGSATVAYARAIGIRLEGEQLAVDWASYDLPSTTTTVRYLVMGDTATVANDTGPQYPPT